MKYIVLLLMIYRVLSAPEDESILEFVKGNHKFAGALYKEMLEEESGNFIVSPLSVEVILALTNEGAKGQTSEELVKGISLPTSKENTQKALRFLLPKIKKIEDGTQLLSANKMYIHRDVKFQEEFQRIAETVYDAGIENVDFVENREEAIATINNWVENNTNHRIKDLIKQTDIGDYTKMVLVNSLYFSGKWLYQFDNDFTYKHKFYRSKEDFIEINAMRQAEVFNYFENPSLNAKFLELPYEGGDLSMVIVLPNERDGLHDLERNIEHIFDVQSYTENKVTVELPLFSVQSEIKLIPILQRLGIEKLFNDGADLTGVSSTEKRLFVSQVVQKAFINVTEGGTEAAAATSDVLTDRIDLQWPSITFIADHPFLYFIKSHGVVIFIGRYTANP